jgi:hypothetical protein
MPDLLREEVANIAMTVAPVEEHPKPGNYRCAVAPIGTNQNRHVGDHHDQFLKRYDEFRGHAQTEPKQQRLRREIEQD